MNAPSHVAFRLSGIIFAAILAIQCLWILLTELYRPGIDRLPTSATSADTAAKRRNDATWAAFIGGIRGDLWAQSAYTFANVLWAAPGNSSEAEQARIRLDRAVLYAPHQSDMWLLLAGMAARYQWSKPNSAEALKMSYYTGPSERALMPLRLMIATQSNAPDDVEVQQFVRRDLRTLIAQQRVSAITEAYADASPAGMHLIEEGIREIDPAYLRLLHSGAQKP